MIDLRILGWAWADQTLRQTTSRFGPWLTGSLWLLLATGILMVIGEPVRELVTFSFWLKMALVAIGTLVAVIFQRTLRRHEQQWEDTLVHRRSIKALAVLTFLVWVCIIVLGRLIAYDHVWGAGRRRRGSSGHRLVARLARSGPASPSRFATRCSLSR